MYGLEPGQPLPPGVKWVDAADIPTRPPYMKRPGSVQADPKKLKKLL